MCSSPPQPPFAPLDELALALSLAATVLFPVGVLASVLFFFSMRKFSTRLRKRNTTLLVISACSVVGAGWSTTVLYDLVGATHYPCALFGLLFYLACPLSGGPLLLKVLHYSSSIALQKLRENPDADLSPNASWSFFTAHLKFTFRRQACTREERVKSTRFASTRAYLLMWLSIPTLPYLVAYIAKLAATPSWNQGCYGCELDLADCIILLCINFGNMLIIFLTVGVHRKSKRDPLQIMHEGFWGNFLALMCINLGLILMVTDPGSAQLEGRIRFRAVTLLAGVVIIYMQTVHQVFTAILFKRHLLTLERVDMEDRFRDVRMNKELNKQFQAYLYSELSGETLRFLDAVEAFRTGGKDGLAARAMDLFKRFVERGRALEEINLPHSIRDEITTAIVSGTLTLQMFDAAYVDIKQSLLRDAFARFVNRLNLSYSTQHAVEPGDATPRSTAQSLMGLIPAPRPTSTLMHSSTVERTSELERSVL